MTAVETPSRPADPRANAASGRPKKSLWALIGNGPIPLLFALVAITVILGLILSDTAFLSSSNLLNIVSQSAPILVMALATVFVITCGEIDLSFAAVVPVAGYVAALTMPEYGWAAGAAVALAVSAAVGLVNGLLTVGLGVPSFIVTLGTMGILDGAARWITNTVTKVVKDPTYIAIFGGGSIGPLSSLVIWAAVLSVLAHVLYKHTAFGRALHATGGNTTAARFSGIRTGRIKITALVLSSLAGGLAGLLYAGRLQSVRFDVGADDLLTVLAAVIIGGTVLAGGRGSIVGAVLGVLLLGVVNNGLVLLGLSIPQQLAFQGGIIIIAVILSAKGRFAELKNILQVRLGTKS
ncbi:ABC transporter permease [Arthrobacter sp. AB6]|uniref:ABC transporter permease n=1 Tax=Arthrobacter sp. AB6 TaxID=2962570 RepID=UPI00288177D9|nr:ABC transporter permease [Arthrobacter sp. AB6]MDT0196455.1 ABC transporter permease [Arthrobacter sp. AB6]